MYGLGQFHHRQNKEEERRGEGRFGKKKTNSYLANIVQQLMAKDRTTSPGRVLGDLAKKATSANS